MRYVYEVTCTNRDCPYEGTLRFIREYDSADEPLCPECSAPLNKERVAHDGSAFLSQNVSTTTVMGLSAGAEVGFAFDGCNIGASSTATTAKLTNPSYISKGDVFMVESELLRTTAVSTTGTCTFTRGAFGTTRAAHSSTATVTLVALGEHVGALKSAVTAAATTFTLDAGYVTFAGAAGDYVRVENEIAKISSVSTSALTVTRGKIGTKAASHAAGKAVVLLRRGGRVTPPLLFSA